MAARRMLKTPLALFGALSLACAGERSVAPSLQPSFSLQHATPFYEQHNLVSDGAVSADLVDAALVNAWGLVASATSPWWVADNGTNVSTLYDGDGNPIPLVVPCHRVVRSDGTYGQYRGGPAVKHALLTMEAGR